MNALKPNLALASLRSTALWGAVFAPLLASAVPVAYDESVSGDLSTTSSSPTSVPLAVGDNGIYGTSGRPVAGGPVDRDFFSFTIPAGQQLSAIGLLPGTTFAGAGSLSFIGAIAAADFGPTAPVSAAGLLGYHHYQASEIGTDILDDIGTGTGAIGFSGPLGPGTYAFWVQETAVASVNYGFNFRVETVSTPDSGSTVWMSVAAFGTLAVITPKRRRA